MEPYVISSKSFTAVAINTASKAGEWVKTKLGNHQRLDRKTSSGDLVTEVDKGAETLIRRLLQAHFPNHEVLGEESVEPGAEALQRALREKAPAEYLWIIDPIDGTTNFVHGFPFFSISIALAHRGDVIVGVVYDPNRDEMFVAEKGKGAYVHGKRMRVSAESRLADSLLATGIPADPPQALAANLSGIQALTPNVRNIRIAGSAALHLAYVAAGRLSGFWEIGLKPWDIAAGKLLVEEAGGIVTDTEGETYRLETSHVAATNGPIHRPLLEALEEADATGF